MHVCQAVLGLTVQTVMVSPGLPLHLDAAIVTPNAVLFLFCSFSDCQPFCRSAAAEGDSVPAQPVASGGHSSKLLSHHHIGSQTGHGHACP